MYLYTHLYGLVCVCVYLGIYVYGYICVCMYWDVQYMDMCGIRTYVDT